MSAYANTQPSAGDEVRDLAAKILTVLNSGTGSTSPRLTFFRALNAFTVGAAQFTFTGGTKSGYRGFSPGGPYEPLYCRDFAMMVRAAPNLFAAADIENAVAVLISGQNVGGRIPDGIYPDGTSLVGGGGRYFAVDNSYELVDLIYSHFLMTGTTSLFSLYSSEIASTLVSHTITDHLCVLDEAQQIGFGFQDGLYSEGAELMTSAMRYRAFGQLAEMATAASVTDIYSAERPLIKAAIESTFADATPLFKNATITNVQHSIPANAYAVVVGACSEARAQGIADFFADCYTGGSLHATKNFYQDGQIKHLPDDETWDSTAGAPAGTYQSGAYWATFTGWVAEVLRRYGYSTIADELLTSLYTKFSTDDPFQRPIEASNSDILYIGNVQYVASAALPLQYLEADTITR